MNSVSLKYLESIFPGRALIPAIEAGRVISMAQQTVYNRLADGSFPVPTHKLGKKRVVRITDLAAYLDGLGAEQKRGRGRPKGSTKAAIAARGK